MGKKLNPIENEIYKRVDEVLYYLWDPIGVSDAPEARDDYYSYIPEIFSSLMNTEDDSEIFDKLLSFQQKNIGIPVDAASKKKTEKIVEILIRHKEWITRTSKWGK